ncbi:MAG TPA: tetratricopeptide repeat protein [bacterium]|nr:tetratricopeptide repeat protein [bacterium]
MKNNFRPFILLVILLQAACGWAALRFTIASQSRSIAAAPQDPYNVLPRLRAMMREQEGVQWVPADSVRAQVGDYLSAQFFQEYEPVSLLQADRLLNLDVVLSYQAVMKLDTLRIWLETKSFPEGILLGATEVRMPKKQPTPLQNQTLATALQNLLLQTIEKHQLFGFPFNETDKGLMVFSDSLADSAYSAQVARYLSNLDLNGEEPVKVALTESPLNNPFCRRALDAAKERGAALIMALEPLAAGSETVRAVLLMRPDQRQLPVVSWQLPLLPDDADLHCDTSGITESELPYVNAALFQHLSNSLTFLEGTTLLEKGNPLLENHVSLWTAFAIRAGRNLSRMPMDSLVYVLKLYERLIESVKPLRQKGWLYLNQAALFEHCGRDEEALAAFKQADTLLTLDHALDGAALSRWRRAVLFSRLKKHPSSRREFARAVQAFESIGDSSSMADATYKIAMLYELDQQSQEARAVYLKAAALYDQLHRSYDAAKIYDHLGHMERGQSNSREAMKHFDAYLLAAREMHSEPAMARAYFQIGVTYMHEGQYQLALENLQKAMDFFEMLGDSLAMARTDINLGTIKQHLDRPDEARSHYLAALQIAESKQDTSITVLCNTNLAEVALRTQSWDEVQSRYDRAMTMAELLQNKKEQAAILYAKGLAHLKEGRLKTGYTELKQALAMAGGTLSGDVEKEQEFMRKLESLIGDIHTIKGSSDEP